MTTNMIHGDDGLHRRGDTSGPISDAEFREAANHTWLNAFSLINPSDDFLRDLGRLVVDNLRESDLRTAPISPPSEAGMSRACVMWFNAS